MEKEEEMCTAQPQDARFRSRPSPPTLAWKLNWPSTWRIQGKKTPQQILFPSASLFLQLLSFFLLCIGFGHQMAGAEELGTCSEEQLPRSILRSICCGDGQEGVRLCLYCETLCLFYMWASSYSTRRSS